MTTHNADLPTRAEVLEHGPALLPEWLQMHVPFCNGLPKRVDHVRLVRDNGSGGEVNFKHGFMKLIAYPCRYMLSSNRWDGMVREAIGILDGEF